MNDPRLRYAVITTRNRPDEFVACYTAIEGQVDGIIVVDHMSNDYVRNVELSGAAAPTVIPYGDDPPNISVMWNLGLEAAEYAAGGRPYDVAVLNDDAIVPDGWFGVVTNAMRQYDATAGSSDTDVAQRRTRLFRMAGQVGPRMSGFAFILNGDDGLRVDEQFVWWYGDDDLEWRAREHGGVVLVPNVPVVHLHPNSTTVGELATIAADDRERFRAKWGRTPH